MLPKIEESEVRSKPKVGVITYWRTQDNYGQILQIYALQRYLEQEGFDPFLIRYSNQKDAQKSSFGEKLVKALNPQKVWHHLTARVRSIRAQMIDEPTRYFDQFKENYLKMSKIYYSYQELKQRAPEADLYIAGSDQIWGFMQKSFQNMQGLFNAYTLNFGSSKALRAGYAVSIGSPFIREEYYQILKERLREFSYLSVRERAFSRYLKEHKIAEPQCDPDPTLLLPAEHYRKLYDQQVSSEMVQRAEKPYLFVYIVAQNSSKFMRAVQDFASKKNLQILYTTGQRARDSFSKIYPSIFEWLYLIDHAEYVFVNSYHGAIFSYLFKKKFLVKPRSGMNRGMNSRMETLFSLLNLGDRFIHSNGFENIEKSYHSSSSLLPSTQFSELLGSIRR